MKFSHHTERDMQLQFGILMPLNVNQPYNDVEFKFMLGLALGYDKN